MHNHENITISAMEIISNLRTLYLIVEGAAKSAILGVSGDEVGKEMHRA